MSAWCTKPHLHIVHEQAETVLTGGLCLLSDKIPVLSWHVSAPPSVGIINYQASDQPEIVRTLLSCLHGARHYLQAAAEQAESCAVLSDRLYC